MMSKDQLLLIKFNKLYSALPSRHDSRGRIFKILSEHEGISQSKLQDIVKIKPGSLSELLQKMENAGQIVRKPDENDKRKRNVYITDAGREAFKELHAGHESESREFFSDLTDEEKDTLLELMDKLLEKHGVHSKHDRKNANTGEFEK